VDLLVYLTVPDSTRPVRCDPRSYRGPAK
jgi:hypothetical protein